MKKRIGALLLCTLLMMSSAALAQAPQMPEDMLAAQDAHFPVGEKYEVYLGPGEEYMRAGDGKGTVSTNDWIQVFGEENAWLMIQYEISDGRMRIGYIRGDVDARTADGEALEHIPLELSWAWSPAHTKRIAAFSDDPFGKRETILFLEQDKQVTRLGTFGEFAYVETQRADGKRVRGFVDADLLEEELVPVEENEAFVQAMQFLEDAGIEAAASGMNGNTLFFSLENGGTARYWHYAQGYDLYEMNWRFSGACDADIARYLDANLEALSQVQFGHLKADWLTGEHAEWNRNATVSNGFNALENLGDQGLAVLLEQLGAHDGKDELNSMRARLASRMLGTLDATDVSSEAGCAWYDALMLRVQNPLPPVDAAMYVDEPLMQQVTQGMIAYIDAQKADWTYGRDVDMGKVRNIVCIHAHRTREKGNSLTVWGVLEEKMIALYDWQLVRDVCGSYVPCRMEFAREEGVWRLQRVTEAEDGSRYAPSILKLCDGDKGLADALMKEQNYSVNTAVEAYLRACGVEDFMWE